MPSSARRLLFIDYLRAIAITLVVVRHLLDRIVVHAGTPGLDQPGWFALYALAGFGWSGVHLFFLVSGYLVGGYVIQSTQAGRFPLGDFLTARALRILPAAYAVIVVVGVLFFNDQYLLPGIVKNFAFVQTYTSGGFMPHYWSLCVEMHFYAALPIVAYAFRHRTFSSRTVVLAIVAFAALRAALPYALGGGYLMKPTMTHWLPDFFAAGILIALRPIRIGRLARPRAALAAYSCGALGLALMTGDPIANVDKANWGVGLAFALIASTVIFLAVQRAELQRAGTLVNAAVEKIATLSYAIYLVHVPVIDHAGGSLLVALGGTAVAALALHYAIEKPGLAIKDQLRNAAAPSRRAD